MLKDLLAGCASLVFPPHCLLCQKPLTNPQNNILCPSCIGRLEENVPPFCAKCSRHLHTAGNLCRNCRTQAIHFDFAWSALQFNAPLQALLHQYKYHHKTVLRRIFAQFMLKFIRDYNLDVAQFDCIIPIPIFSSNFRLRGYNQSLLLARCIGQHYRLPVLKHILHKCRPTPSQSELNRKERWTNLSGAFTIKHSELIKNKRILLVDDLLTTGATCSLAAQALKKAGCNTVGVLTLATVP